MCLNSLCQGSMQLLSLARAAHQGKLVDEGLFENSTEFKDRIERNEQLFEAKLRLIAGNVLFHDGELGPKETEILAYIDENFVVDISMKDIAGQEIRSSCSIMKAQNEFERLCVEKLALEVGDDVVVHPVKLSNDSRHKFADWCEEHDIEPIDVRQYSDDEYVELRDKLAASISTNEPLMNSALEMEMIDYDIDEPDFPGASPSL